ncbi:MAG: translocation/assembly module TamB domain-containing protein [Chitinophagales bacterium]
MSIGKVQIRFFNSLTLNEVLIRDLNHDTLIASKTIEAKFSIISLLKGQYAVEFIRLDEAVVFLHKLRSDTVWNYQFLADALSSKSTSSEKSSFKLDLESIEMNQTHFVMLDEPNIIKLDFVLPELQIAVSKMDFDQPLFDLKKILLNNSDFKITKLKRTEIDTSTYPQPDTNVVHINSKNISLLVADLEFTQSRFTYDDLNEPESSGGFDGFHQRYDNLNLHFINGSLIYDTISARIENISFQEKSGFIVNHMEADANITPSESRADHLTLITPNSLLSDYFSFTYTNFHAFLNFTDEVTMNAHLHKSGISMKDVSFFIPGMNGNSEKLVADGDVKGTISNLKSKNLKLQTGSISHFAGSIEMKGLPSINETYIELKVNDLFTGVMDVQRWISFSKVPVELARFGNSHFSGSFSGFVNDFVAYGVFNTQLGQITSDLNMKFNSGLSAAQYSGSLSTSDFNLGKLIAQDSVLGNISFALNVNGSGLRLSTMNAKMSGTLRQIEFLDYNYQNAIVNGTLDSKIFTGNVSLHDPNIRLEFNGKVDMNSQLPVYDFKARIDTANLLALKLSRKPYTVSAKMDMNMSGRTIDDFLGYAKASDIVFSDEKRIWKMDSMLLAIDIKKNGNGRKMLLTTPIADARFDGYFALTKLPRAFLSVIDHYLPSFPGEYPASDTLQDFEFRIALNNISEAEQFFFPDLRGVDSTKILGHFNSAQYAISFLGKVPALGYRNFDFGDVTVSAETKNDSFHVKAGSRSVRLSDSLSIMDPLVEVVLNNNTATVFMKGASPDNLNYVNILSKISGDYSLLQMHIMPSDLVLNGRPWKISEDNLITYSEERLMFQNFSLTTETRMLTVSNVNTRVKATNLQLDFENIPIHDFHEFISWNDVQLNGNLNGTMQVYNVLHSPRYSSSITINDFSANGKKVSLVTGNVSYLPEDDRMTLKLQLSDEKYDVVASGYYYPLRGNDQLRIEMDIKKADLEMLEALLFEGMISNTAGSAYGNLLLTGSPARPMLTGEVNVTALSTKVNYLQTVYHCHDVPIIFKENEIDLGKLTLFDENNDSAQARGSVFHNHLGEWSMNVSIATKEFLVLKTTAKDDSVFYGTAVASGIVRFIGAVDEMEIRASVTSLKGTNISVPVSSASSFGQRSFIRYVNKNDSLQAFIPSAYYRVAGLTMDLNLEITPEAEIQIIFDEQTGDIIRGSGNGNIRMAINTKGDFSMFGTFTIERGNYLFTQFNFFNKYFTIENGGTIVWNGDPYGAAIVLSAIYSTRASLIDLVPQAAGISDNDRRELQKRYAVDLYLKLSGNLFSPDISFDIRLPEVSTVSSAANVELLRLMQDENELNRQAFGIIVLGHFIPPGTTGLGGQSLGATGINSLSGFISSQINSLASQVRSDIDFAVNYQSYQANLNSNTNDPNSFVQRNELQVALTKRFFNDRLAVDVGGNFDFGSSNPGLPASQGTNGVAGDFSVEYKITPDGRVSGKVFSTSDYDVIDERNKTRNGVAIKYTRDFDNLRELIKDPEKKKQRELKREVKKKLKEKKEMEAPDALNGK